MNLRNFILGIGIFFILLGVVFSHCTYNFYKDSEKKVTEQLNIIDEDVLPTYTTTPKKTDIVKMIGCTILSGQDVTYFKHINDLKKNDEIKVETAYGNFTYKVTKSELVHVGDEIQNTTKPTIILETCFPFDARYLTDKRYLVFAEFSDSQLK